MISRYEVKNKQNRLALFFSDIELLCSGKIVKKQIGNPLKINPDGIIDLPSTPDPRFTRSQPVSGTTGITPKMALANLKKVPQKSNHTNLKNGVAEMPQSSSMTQPTQVLTQPSQNTPTTSSTAYSGQKNSKRRRIDFDQTMSPNNPPDLDSQSDRYICSFRINLILYWFLIFALFHYLPTYFDVVTTFGLFCVL